jgi:hypothetical protein
MEAKLVFSLLVTIFSLGLTLIGIPAQILKNYREKRSGQPLVTILIALGFYASQIVLFIITKTYLPLIAFLVGLVMWAITLGQFFAYRQR